MDEQELERRAESKKRQRRSYSCGSCKLLKIKCDLQIPCSSCVKFKRIDKCLEHPPRPPSQEELTRIQERKQRSYNKKNRLGNIPEDDPSHTFANVSPNSDGNTPSNGNSHLYTLGDSPGGGSGHGPVSVLPPAHIAVSTGVSSSHAPVPGYLTASPNPNGVPRYSQVPLPISSAYQPSPMPQLPGLQQHLSPDMHPIYQPDYSQAHIHYHQAHQVHQNQYPQMMFHPYQLGSPHLGKGLNSPALNAYRTSPPGLSPNANGNGSAHNRNGSVSSISSQPAKKSPPRVCPMVINRPPISILANPFSDDPSLGSIDLELSLDEQHPVQISMIELGRIKRLLPNSFSIVSRLHDLYVRSESEHITALIKHKEFLMNFELIYNKIIATDEQDIRKSFTLSLVEMRYITLFFLIMANGLLWDDQGLTNFLVEATIYKPNKDIMADWIKLSKFLKSKILSYSKISDIIFLMDWFFIIKTFYTFEDQIVENYLEFNNLLNYVVLNQKFVDLIEDPEKEVSPQDTRISSNATTGTNILEYPRSIEFKILARYWMQLRLVEIDFSFFQFKGSLLSSPQLKGSILPHKKLLTYLYGEDQGIVEDPMIKFAIQLWGMYYKRDENYASTTHIIRRYLYLYGNVVGLLHDDLKKVEAKFYSTPASPTTEEISLYEFDVQQIGLLLTNQLVLSLFVRWLSFIRIEADHFPSLRFASYLTSMTNLFNHFMLMDKLMEGKYGQSHDLLTEMFNHYQFTWLRPVYNCLVSQAVFLIVLQDFVHEDSREYLLDVRDVYKRVSKQFHYMVERFSKSKALETFNKVPLFRKSLALVQGVVLYLEESEHDLRSPTVPKLVEKLEQFIEPESWEILLNQYYGSMDMLVGYAEKVWDLFAYLEKTGGKSNGLEPQNGSKWGSVPITKTIALDDDMIKNTNSKLTGFAFDTKVVDDYISHVVKDDA